MVIKLKDSRGLALISIFIVFMSMFMVNMSDINEVNPPNLDNSNVNDFTSPRESESLEFPWWNENFEYRMRVDVSPNSVTQDTPAVEMYINFSQILVTNNVPLTERVNNTNIRVIEQQSNGYTKEYVVQYDHTGPLGTDQGQICWVIDEVFDANKTFFIYFCLGDSDALNNPIIPSDNTRNKIYRPFRLYHQGFEDASYVFESGVQPGSQDMPATGDVERSTSIPGIRGNAGLIVRGNRWPALSVTNTYAITAFTGAVTTANYPTLILTYSFVAVDSSKTSPEIEIIAIGFESALSALTETNYQSHWGSQSWGGIKLPVAEMNTWYYYTRNIKTISSANFNWIVLSLDDDATPRNYLGANWDDISIWNVSVKQHATNKLINTINGLEKASSNFNIQVLDLDGFPVPDARIYISNASQPFWSQNGLTNNLGLRTFTNVSIGRTYNITVNYTAQGVNNPNEFQIAWNDNVLLTDYNYNLTVNSSIWSMEFNVINYDNQAVEDAFVLLYDDNQVPIVNGTLNAGKCTMRYQNVSNALNYTVFLDTTKFSTNEVYNTKFLNISDGIISRTYADKPELITHSLYEPYWVSFSGENRTSTNNQEIYGLVYDAAFGNRKIGYVQIDMINFTANITSYSYDAYLNDDSFVNILKDTKIHDANHSVTYQGLEMRGIRFAIQKTSSDTNARINISTYLRTTAFLTANITTYTFNITALKLGVTNPLANAICVFRNEQNISIANITTSDTGLIHLTYLRWIDTSSANYSLQVQFIGVMQDLNQTNNPIPLVDWLNFRYFTLDSARKLDVMVDFETKDYKTNLNVTNFNPIPQIVLLWGQTKAISLNYTFISNNVAQSISADTVQFFIRDEDFGLISTGIIPETIKTGEYNWTFDSTVLLGGNDYIIQFTAQKSGYPQLAYVDQLRVEVQVLPTTKTLTDLSKGNAIDGLIVPKYWGEKFNVSLVFSSGSNRLSGAAAILDCDFIASTSMYETGSGNSLYYTYEINTGLALSLGQYLIQFTISLDNYTTQSTFFQLLIKSIPTTINSTNNNQVSSLLRLPVNINKTDSLYFNFSYFDSFNNKTVTELTISDYSWDYFGPSGSVPLIIGNGNGKLVELSNGNYLLDFNTTTRDVGSYILLVTLEKQNYERRQAMIILDIKNRTINRSLVGDFAGVTQITHIKGDKYHFAVKLMDDATGMMLTGATVQIYFEELDLTLILSDDDNDGIYLNTYDFSEIPAFYSDAVLTGSLIISRSNYDGINIPIIVTVQMEQIFPQMPTFYFLLIVVGIAILVGTLVVNKVITNARIPPFVRLIEGTKKKINAKKDMLEERITKTLKDEYVELFAKKWSLLGLDLNAILSEDVKPQSGNIKDMKAPITPSDKVEKGGK